MSNAHFTTARDLRASQTAEYRAKTARMEFEHKLRAIDGLRVSTMGATRDILAARYVARIRNKRKREYASAYLAFLRQEATIAPAHNGLSFMAAQAV